MNEENNPDTVTVTVDMREHDLTPLLPDATVSNLDIADIQVQWGKEKCIYIERKKVSDLKASIRDGRYREQKVRLLTAAPPKHIIYMIEGNVGFSDPSIVGAIINTQLKDGIHMMFSRSAMETSQWVIEIANRVKKEPEKYFTELKLKDDLPVQGSAFASPSGTEWIDHVKVKRCKIDNIDPKTCFELQLCQIPSISTKIAQNISMNLPEDARNMGGFLRYITNNVNFLNNIPLVGPKKRESIKLFLGLQTHLNACNE